MMQHADHRAGMRPRHGPSHRTPRRVCRLATLELLSPARALALVLALALALALAAAADAQSLTPEQASPLVREAVERRLQRDGLKARLHDITVMAVEENRQGRETATVISFTSLIDVEEDIQAHCIELRLSNVPFPKSCNHDALFSFGIAAGDNQRVAGIALTQEGRPPEDDDIQLRLPAHILPEDPAEWQALKTFITTTFASP